MRNLINITLIFLSFLSSAQKVDTNYEKNKKRVIKMEFFSPLTGNTTLGYESYIKDWLSWEAKVGIIGLGVDNDDLSDYKGFLLKGGPKFKLNPDFVTDDLRGSHLLSGKYIRPEVIFAHYTAESQSFDPSLPPVTETFSSLAIIITYGRQYVLGNITTLDYHIGLGYAYDSSKEGRYNFSHSNGASDFPVAISAGLTIGILLK